MTIQERTVHDYVCDSCGYIVLGLSANARVKTYWEFCAFCENDYCPECAADHGLIDTMPIPDTDLEPTLCAECAWSDPELDPDYKEEV